MFTCNNVLFFREEDNWENGCLPNTGSSGEYGFRLKAETPDQVIEICMEHVGTDDRLSVEINACDEPGRIDVCVTEDETGTPLSKHEYEQWKAGEIKAYYTVYTFYWSECKPANFESVNHA